MPKVTTKELLGAVRHGPGMNRGWCYITAESLYHQLGGREAGLTPMHIYHEGMSHWYLRWEKNGRVFYIDPTSTQFKTPVPYWEGTGRGFLTKEPSKQARELLS
jgi:hypothetical protein